MAWVVLANFPIAGTEPSWYCGDPAVGGKVYAGSGTSVYAYDPASNTWTARASNAVARSPKGAAVYHSGKVYLFGGSNEMTVEVYNPATNTWSTLASMPKPFANVNVGGSGFALRYGGSILVGTFEPSGFGGSYDVGRYDIATNTWATISGLSVNTDGFVKSGTMLGDYGYMLRSGDVARLDPLTVGLILPTITGGAGNPNSGTSLAAFGTKLVVWGGGTGGDVFTLDPNTGGEPYGVSEWTDLGSGTLQPTTVVSHSQPYNGDNIFLIGASGGANFFYKLGITSTGATATSAKDSIGEYRAHPRWPELAERWGDGPWDEVLAKFTWDGTSFRRKR